ncbi:excalibur calcium-binding domain-containing protein [Nocardia sp. NPDC046473]|uniref:excalibur calcium-binding domain-containing protein n=1 Tax=Nocardia sp. NPDC046473 TaxID=3155733 RepID=UPI0033EEA906
MATAPRYRAAVVTLIAAVSLASAACGPDSTPTPTVRYQPTTTAPTITVTSTTSATTLMPVPPPVIAPLTSAVAPQPLVPQPPAVPAVAPTTIPPQPTTTVLPAPSVYYPNCAAARAAGAAPMHRGEPGYRPPLDRDNDGIACE